MTDEADDSTAAAPAPYSGTLPPADLPFLRAYIEDIGRWVLKESAGQPLTPELCDALANELAAILSGGLAPSLAAEIERNTQRTIVESQDGPVVLDALGRMRIAGLEVQDVPRLIDAVGQLMDHGVGDRLDLLHPSHRHALSAAHDAWAAAQKDV